MRLFESAPLCVPPEVAERVAADPGDWIDAVADGCRGPAGSILADLVARLNHFDLLCDLPAGVRRALVQPGDPDLQADRVGTGGNGQQYDIALVLAALEGQLDVAGEEDCACGRCDDISRPIGPLVAAALLEPGTVDALSRLLVPADAVDLRELARTLGAPADTVCRDLAQRVVDAA